MRSPEGCPMELSELLERLARAFDELDIPYLVTGSVATIAYGEPRFTNDLDVVVRLPLSAVDAVLAVFPEGESYVSRDAMLDAIGRSTQFNILHPRSGLKIDVMVAGPSEFNASRFGRARRLAISSAAAATFAFVKLIRRGPRPPPVSDRRLRGSAATARCRRSWR